MDFGQQGIVILKIALAMFLGGLLGMEREIAAKPAGFRTHMLVAGAAALLMSLGDSLLDYFSEGVSGEIMRSDPIRIVEAIITGISFLGAGTIFRSEKDKVAGITTAATILLAAAIGMAVSLEQYVLAAGVSFLALAVLVLLNRTEKWLSHYSADDS